MKREKRRVLTSDRWILLGLFFLAAMNFQAKLFYLIFAALLIYVVLKRKIRVEQNVIWYIIFTAVYFVYALQHGWMEAIRKFAFIGCYVLGFDTMLAFAKNGKKDCQGQEGWLKAILIALATGAWTHLMLNYYINYGTDISRNTIDIWTGLRMAATGQAALAVLMLAVSIAVLLLPRHRYERWLALGAVLSIILYNFMLAGRMIPVMSIIIMLSCVMFVFMNREIPRTARRNAIVTFTFIGICASVMLIFDVADIRTELMTTNLIERFAEAETIGELFEDGRFIRKRNFLEHMFEYPFGGLHLREKYGYAHDLLLDAYDECGIMMLIALIAILWNSIRDFLRFLKAPYWGYQIKCIVICTYLVLLIEFCMEPIFAGMSWLFACFALINGCIRGAVYTNG